MWYALLLYVSSILIGIDKGGIPGLGALGISTVLAQSGGLLARRSLGIFVPVLTSADLFALYVYGDSIRWDIVRDLILPLSVGMFAGFCLLGRLPDDEIRICVGWALLFVNLWSYAAPYVKNFFAKKMDANDASNSKGGGQQLPVTVNCLSPPPSSHFRQHLFRAAIGFIAGFLTVIANVAGPIIAVYLMSLSLPQRHFTGTRACIFVVTNCCKIPGQILLGNLRVLEDLSTVVPLCIAAVLSTYTTELFLIPRIDQPLFEKLSWCFVTFGALKLVLRF